MSEFQRWLYDHGYTYTQALEEADCSPETFNQLWAGSRTIPRIALAVGKSLGMDAESVRMLGKPLTPHIWDCIECRVAQNHAIDFHPQWYTFLEGGKIKPCRATFSQLRRGDKAKRVSLGESRNVDWFRRSKLKYNEYAVSRGRPPFRVETRYCGEPKWFHGQTAEEAYDKRDAWIREQMEVRNGGRYDGG